MKLKERRKKIERGIEELVVDVPPEKALKQLEQIQRTTERLIRELDRNNYGNPAQVRKESARLFDGMELAAAMENNTEPRETFYD